MIKKFTSDESGAITVDWVVLTASIVGIAIAVLLVISGGLSSASSGVDGQLSDTDSVSDTISGIVASAEPEAWDGTGLPDNVSQFPEVQDEGDHQHYGDGNGQVYSVHDGTTMTEGWDSGGEVVGTVDGSGNITPV